MVQLSLFDDIDTLQFKNYCTDIKIITNNGFYKYITGDIEEIDWKGVCRNSIIGGAKVICNNKEITVRRKGKKDIVVGEAEIRNRLNYLKREYLEEGL